jgi:hypothetical protein
MPQQPDMLADVMKDNWSEPLARGGGGRGGFSLSAGVNGDVDPYKEAMSNAPKDGVEGPPQPPSDPYKGMGGQGGDKPEVLGGGSMGLKPDLSEARRIQKQYNAVLEKRSPFMAGFRGMPEVYAAQDAKWQQRIQMAERKAYQDAMDARAANEWVDDDVIESGQIQQVNPLTGKTRLKTTEETYKEQAEGPYRSADEIPYREATRQVPVYDKNMAERRMIGRQGVEGDLRRHANELGQIGARTEGQLKVAGATGEESRKTEGVRHGYDMSEIGARNAGDMAVANVRASQPRTDPYDTPAGEGATERTLISRVLSSMNFVDADDFKQNATPEQRDEYGKRIAKAREEVAPRGQNQVPAGPGGTADYGGPVTSAPKVGDVKKRKLRGGGTVEVRYAGNGKWEPV